MEEIVSGLSDLLEAELNNLKNQKESLEHNTSTLEDTEERVLTVESFDEIKQEIDELRHDASLTSEVRESVNKAFNAIVLDNRNETRKYIVEAHARVEERD